jgi:hypothetical protein
MTEKRWPVADQESHAERRRKLKGELIWTLAEYFDGNAWDFVGDEYGLSEKAVESVVSEIAESLRRRAERLAR